MPGAPSDQGGFGPAPAAVVQRERRRLGSSTWFMQQLALHLAASSRVPHVKHAAGGRLQVGMSRKTFPFLGEPLGF